MSGVQTSAGAQLNPRAIRFTDAEVTYNSGEDVVEVSVGSGSLTASDIGIVDAGTQFTATDVEAALDEILDALQAYQLSNDNVRVSQATFTETAAAGVYTADFDEVPSGAILLAYGWQTTAAWDADTTALNLGDADPDRFYDDVDVDGADEVFDWVGSTAYPLIVATSLSAFITTTGAGGATGRSTVTVVWAEPEVTAATKVAS